MTRTNTVLTTTLLLAFSASANAKPIHYEDLKLMLVEQNIACTTCHTAPDSPELTAYGQRIAAVGTDESMHDRVKTVEMSLSQTATEEERTSEESRMDVDGDGLANWIEILAGTDPSSKSEKNELHARIENTVNCHLCHESVNRFAGNREDRAPHNAFGKTLRAKKRKGRRNDGKRSKSIVQRIAKTRTKDTDRDGIKDLDEIITFHHPADKTDTPEKNAVKTARKRVKTRRKPKDIYGKIHTRKRAIQ